MLPTVTYLLDMPTSLFAARLLGYIIGLVPLIALLLMFRQVIPQTLALGLMGAGVMGSLWVQQQLKAKFPYNFKDRSEWLALGLYAVLVVGIILLIQFLS